MHSYEELQCGGAHLVFIVLMLALGEWLSFQSARTGQIKPRPIEVAHSKTAKARRPRQAHASIVQRPHRDALVCSEPRERSVEALRYAGRSRDDEAVFDRDCWWVMQAAEAVAVGRFALQSFRGLVRLRHGKCGFSELDGCPFQRQESALTQGLQDHLGQQSLRPIVEKRWCALDPVACAAS